MQEEELMRPFVQVAAICQTAIQDIQGALSLIKIMDRLQVFGVNDEMQPQPLSHLTLAVVLKSGPMRGAYKWSLTVITPSHKRIKAFEATALFEGDERGIAMVSPIQYIAEEDGLYWFEVGIEGQMLTRIPLRIMYQKITPLQGQTIPGPNAD